MALATLVLVFASATVYFGMRMLNEKASILSSYSDGAALAVQLEAEHQRLSAQTARYESEPTEANRQALFERFRSFKAQIPLVLTSDTDLRLPSLADMLEPIGAILADVPNLERELSALDPARSQTFVAVRARLGGYAGPIEDLSHRVLHRQYFNGSDKRIVALQREVIATYVVMLVAGGLLIFLLWYQNRLAEQLTAEAELSRGEAERAQRRLHDAVDSISEGFLLLDADRRVILVNQRFYELLPDELRGFGPGDDYRTVIRAAGNLGFYGQDVSPGEAAQHRLARLEDPDEPFELTNPDGSQIRIHEYVTADGGRVSLRTDVTSLRRAERERLELQAQFYRTQKTEALGRLAGGIAHDFNNALMSIQGYANFLREDLPAGTSEWSYAEKILSDSQRAAALVRQILDFGRHGGGIRQAIQLDAIVGEAVALLKASLPEAIGAHFRDKTGGALVNADAAQIAQVAMNLCVNARDAIGGAGGVVDVTLYTTMTDGIRAERLLRPQQDGADVAVPTVVERGRDGRNRLWIGVLPPARYHVLEVRDDGVGMDLVTLERIFDPFFTTKPQDQGSGLGLAAVYGIVLAHGGALSVETSMGAGTSVSVFLPALAAELGDDVEGESESEPAVRVARRILVVDDDPEMAEVVALSLRGLDDLEVETAGSADQALQRLQHEPEIDLVVSERHLGGTSEHDLAAEVDRLCPNLPVIFTASSVARREDAVSEPKGGGPVSHKPLDASALCQAVERALDASRPPRWAASWRSTTPRSLKDSAHRVA
ncbi:ATP-binding protein [Algihabitans albus]|uniref:ATP-binding protein n=1 Tax=Algihabitans albus TaxID=2164067 RepID=UPI000E5CDA41|nr:ATP-binding protein [Algihabitans albus]